MTLRQFLLMSPLCLLASGCLGAEPPGIPSNIPADREVTWSPDGQQIAFLHTGGTETPGLYVAGIDGRDRRLLVAGQFGSPDWSPDGTAIALTLGFAYQILRFDLAADTALALTTSGFNGTPSWSPSGQTIAFSSDGGDSRNPPDLWLMNADGTSLRRIPLGTPPRNGLSEPDWDPTGARLVASGAFSTGPTTFVEALFVTDTAGRDTVWFEFSPAQAAQPAWSPDGNWIAYVKARTGSPGDIWLIRPDGAEDHVLITNGAFPAWSPDGGRIAFSRSTAEEGAIWSVDVASGSVERLSWPRGPDSPGSLP